MKVSYCCILYCGGKTFVNRFGPPEWLESRRLELELFLNRLLNHDQFCYSMDLVNFLTISKKTFIKYRYKHPASSQIIPKVPLARNATGGSTHQLSTLEVEPWFDEQSEYVGDLVRILSGFRKTLAVYTQQRLSMEQPMSELAQAALDLKEVEQNHDDSLAHIWKAFGELIITTIKINQEIADIELEFQRSVRDEKLVSQAAAELVKKRPKIAKISLEINETEVCLFVLVTQTNLHVRIQSKKILQLPP